MKTSNRLIALLLAFVMVMSLAACGKAESSESAAEAPKATIPTNPVVEGTNSTETDETLVVLMEAATTSITCLSNATGGMIGNTGFGYLLSYDAENCCAVPDNATYEEIDATHYRFTIRDEAKFFDGTPVTAEDVLYSFQCYQDCGYTYIKYIDVANCVIEDSLTPEAYGKFLCGLFDVWYADWTAGKYVSVRLFEDYVYNLMGLPCGTCASSGACGQYLVVESDGSAYPCDFYCLDQWRLGKLGEMSIAELLHCEREMAFLAEPRNEDCKQCQWYAACRGGCKRDFHTLQGKSHNYYCPAFQRFFAYAWPRLRNVAQQERAARRGSRNNTVYLNE